MTEGKVSTVCYAQWPDNRAEIEVTVIIMEMSVMSIEKSRPQIVTSVYSPYTRRTRSQLRSERGSGTKAVRA